MNTPDRLIPQSPSETPSDLPPSATPSDLPPAATEQAALKGGPGAGSFNLNHNESLACEWVEPSGGR